MVDFSKIRKALGSWHKEFRNAAVESQTNTNNLFGPNEFEEEAKIKRGAKEFQKAKFVVQGEKGT